MKSYVEQDNVGESVRLFCSSRSGQILPNLIFISLRCKTLTSYSGSTNTSELFLSVFLLGGVVEHCLNLAVAIGSKINDNTPSASSRHVSKS